MRVWGWGLGKEGKNVSLLDFVGLRKVTGKIFLYPKQFKNQRMSCCQTLPDLWI